MFCEVLINLFFVYVILVFLSKVYFFYVIILEIYDYISIFNKSNYLRYSRGCILLIIVIVVVGIRLGRLLINRYLFI